MDPWHIVDRNDKSYVAQDVPKRIKHIQFQPFTPKDIVRISECEVSIPDLYTIHDDGLRSTAKGGPLDGRLGPNEKGRRCLTCGEEPARCVGHYGYIKLALPVFHIGYFRPTINMLSCICKTCSRILLPREERETFLNRFRRSSLDSRQRTSANRAILASCKKQTICRHCGAINGPVKKLGPMRIVHEPFRAAKVAKEKEEHLEKYRTAMADDKHVTRDGLKGIFEDLNPVKVLALFQRISAEDCELLSLHPDIGRPEDYIWRYVSVPPPAIRPSVASEAGNNEDDLTAKLAEIAHWNKMLQITMDNGRGLEQIMNNWETLGAAVALYINSQTPGLAAASGKPSRGFVQRLKGKQGRFRGNLSGKRVDFSGRTVIGPDPNLRIDEVAIPEKVAVKLSYPERVNDYNITAMRQAIMHGSKVHPGANVLEKRQADGSTIRIALHMMKDADKRRQFARELRTGDIVHRHVRDGDIALFNRQPSLHKLSIMCHRVRVRPWRTFRLNECVCNPYNADFDGDEMNLHIPQTEEARTEALELMSVKKNLVTPRNGEPIIAAIQDFITASFLLSRRDRFFNRQQFTQICSFFCDGNLDIEIPPPTIWKPQRMWTGKQIFNLLMKPNRHSRIQVNLEAKCRTMKDPDPKDHFPPDMSPNDGYLVIVNSEIMCGVFDKNTVGDGKKKSVFGVILRDYGPEEAASAMNRLAKLAARWLANQGFSLGINDVIPGPKLHNSKDSKVEDAYNFCDGLIDKAKKGLLQNAPGCDQDTTLEQEISGTLSKVRGEVGELCMQDLSRHNAPLIMATCGSKGSVINVAQMVACVGQQIISGNRIPNGFQDRSLPHFHKKSRNPPSKGFVRNSFYTGLSPTEFLFHAISGREGLVDTAVKTAETGYMARRLMKAMEDLSTHYDLSVRNSEGGVVQFQYGDDMLDPACLEGDATPVDYPRTWTHACRIASREGKALLPYEVLQLARSIYPESMEVAPPPPKKARRGQPAVKIEPGTLPAMLPGWDNCHSKFREITFKFIQEKIVRVMAEQRLSRGLPPAETPEDAEEYGDLLVPQDFAVRQVLDNANKVSADQIHTFLEICRVRYLRSQIEPGSTVGAVGAQSIGEPGTQMTLKTFHFAGVASMNVTLGVPRIKEIINAAKIISTPIITAELVNATSEHAARIVKGRVERTVLGDIASVIEETWTDQNGYIEVHIDMEAVQRLQLEITMDSIRDSLCTSKLKLAAPSVTPLDKLSRVRIYIDEGKKGKENEGLYERLKALKRALPDIQIKGLPQVDRGVITKDEKNNDVNRLLVTGYGLAEVMGTDGVDGLRTKTNHVMETADVLGIEAARQTIYNEIQHTMQSHGMSIDPRHVMLLGDVMTYKGEVLGITRFGVQKMKDSVLMLASFEKTTDHLFDASLFSKKDSIQGVSECIIMGTPAPACGTSMASIVTPAPPIPQRKPLLFEEAFKRGRERRETVMDWE